MQEFLDDLVKNLEVYYYQLVALTPKILLALIVIVIVWLIAGRIKMFADARCQRSADIAS